MQTLPKSTRLLTHTLFCKSTPVLAALAAFCLAAPAARAQVTISYSLSHTTFFAPTGDTNFTAVASPTTQMLTLMPGVAQTLNVQMIYFDVYPTSDAGDDYKSTFTRSLTVDAIKHSVTQGFDLTTNPGDGVNTLYANDSLILYPGQTTTFDLGSKGVLTFTPEVLDSNGIFSADSGADGLSPVEYTDNVKGKFLLTPAAVPEASTTVSFGLLLALGLGGVMIAMRKTQASAAV